MFKMLSSLIFNVFVFRNFVWKFKRLEVAFEGFLIFSDYFFISHVICGILVVTYWIEIFLVLLDTVFSFFALELYMFFLVFLGI